MALSNRNNNSNTSRPSIATQSRVLFLKQERSALNRQQSMLNRSAQRVGLD